MSSTWRTAITRRNIIAGTLFLCALVAVGYVLYLHFLPVHTPDTPSVLRNEFIHSIERLGAPRAYAAFSAAYGPEPFEIQHNAAHLFGEALYDVKRLKGIAACDQTFNFGCYHGFMSRAIAREGLLVVRELDRVCKSDTAAPTACEHGIGHGILEFVGHAKLLPALDACKLTNQQDPVAGCTSGVFMEYNVPLETMEGGAVAVQARPLVDTQKPFDICPDMPDQYRQSCYQELPQWWIQVLTTDIGEMGKICSTAETEVLRIVCYNGITKIVPSQGQYSPSTIITMCSSMPNDTERTRCLVGASWGLVNNVGLVEEAAEVCAQVPAAEQYRCPK